jgi:hypothetical protein
MKGVWTIFVGGLMMASGVYLHYLNLWYLILLGIGILVFIYGLYLDLRK